MHSEPSYLCVGKKYLGGVFCRRSNANEHCRDGTVRVHTFLSFQSPSLTQPSPFTIFEPRHQTVPEAGCGAPPSMFFLYPYPDPLLFARDARGRHSRSAGLGSLTSAGLEHFRSQRLFRLFPRNLPKALLLRSTSDLFYLHSFGQRPRG